MITRVIVGTFHTGLAALMAVAGAVLLVQGEVNVRWESGFYGQVGPGSLGMVIAAVLMLTIAALEATIGVAFAIGQRWAVHAQILLSLALMVMFPAPINVLMALAVGGGLLELVPPRSELEEEEEDE